MLPQPNIVISSEDYRRLSALLDDMPGNDATDLLTNELERAEIVEPKHMPPNVATMHSTVTFTVLATQKTFTYTLVYPREADGADDKLSILTPVGSALLGLSVGQEIEWPLAAGKTTRVRIDVIVYQPKGLA